MHESLCWVQRVARLPVGAVAGMLWWGNYTYTALFMEAYHLMLLKPRSSKICCCQTSQHIAATPVVATANPQPVFCKASMGQAAQTGWLQVRVIDASILTIHCDPPQQLHTLKLACCGCRQDHRPADIIERACA